jgi:DNA-dependent RNA polymerase auxiliary subunit epsilon
MYKLIKFCSFIEAKEIEGYLSTNGYLTKICAMKGNCLYVDEEYFPDVRTILEDNRIHYTIEEEGLYKITLINKSYVILEMIDKFGFSRIFLDHVIGRSIYITSDMKEEIEQFLNKHNDIEYLINDEPANEMAGKTGADAKDTRVFMARIEVYDECGIGDIETAIEDGLNSIHCDSSYNVKEIMEAKA